jgi:hypothetical protein
MPLIPRPDLRSVAPLVLVGLVAAPAAAAPPVDLGGATIEMDLKLPDGKGGFVAKDAEEERQFMNLANCTCGDDPDARFAVEFELVNPPATRLTEEVDIWAGTSCDSTDLEIRDRCVELDGFAEIDDLREVPEREVAVRDLIGTSSGECNQEDSEKRWVYAIIDEGNDGVNEEDGDHSFPLEIETDTRPPPPPLDIRASGAEGGIQVSWELPDSRTDDIWYFQLLCARADGSSAGEDDFPRADRQYTTSRDVCGIADSATCPIPLDELEEEQPDDDDDDGDDDGTGGADAGSSSDAGFALRGGPDAGPDGGTGDAGTGGDGGPSGECDDLPGRLEILDPDAICGESSSPSSTSLRASGLQNGVPYHVVLVVADRAGNPLAIDLGEQTPRLVKDFWEDYKDQGGRAKGGCTVAQAGLGGGVAIAFALLVGFGLRPWRRRRGRNRRGPGAAAGGALLLALALSPGLAAAQPWWETYDEPVQEEVGPALPDWNLELKLAPYVPDVDGEFDLGSDEQGPFERIYGDGPFLMSGFTLDRFLLHPMGQLGVSLSAGYLTRTVNALELDDEGNVVPKPDGRPRRSPGDTTGFRLVPTSLGVVYRYTQLDDQLRIPLVPYARAGLSYYVWWVTKPGGGVAETPTDDCPDISTGDCEGDRALGGSLGWQASVGLAIRAERIDPEAEIGLRSELGIEHAGLVFEFTYAKVDGFGSSDKLAVGDATWFGGINFEF